MARRRRRAVLQRQPLPGLALLLPLAVLLCVPGAAGGASSGRAPATVVARAAGGDRGGALPMVVGTLDGSLHAISRETGEVLWVLNGGPLLQVRKDEE
mgnify:CR=1 FL=1